jgi:long-chain acyl-CoA synthetase
MSEALPLGQGLAFRLFGGRRRAHVPSDPKLVSFDALIADGSREPAAEIDPHRDLAALQYTGGTTGIPKSRSGKFRFMIKRLSIGGA